MPREPGYAHSTPIFSKNHMTGDFAHPVGTSKLVQAGDDGYYLYNMGKFTFQKGGSLTEAKLGYKTFGDPKSPVIVYPTW